MMKKLIIALLALLSATTQAQRHEVFSPQIASLQVVANTNWLSLPIIRLGTEDVLNIDFDDFTHQYRRYAYRIEHCDADWTTSSELFSSDFIDGFADGNIIENSMESINTNTLYTHYSLQIPNDRCRLKMSGNYRITVIDEETDTPVFAACCMVLESLMGVQGEVTSNTDIDVNHRHQQVSFKLNYGQINVVAPQEQIRTVVMQNMRWDNARISPKPQYVTPTGMQWQHCRDLIFPAGNEYHKFEILDTDRPSMGIDRLEWDGENYHAYPFVAEPRKNYVYDEDADGAFYIRNSDNVENQTASDYVYVHYILQCPQPVKGDVYLNAVWTCDQFLPQYRMAYHEEAQCYEAVVLQKLGYYSYQYVMVDEQGAVRTMPTEGDFYQTENKYQILVYFRGTGERTDRLVGYLEVRN